LSRTVHGVRLRAGSPDVDARRHAHSRTRGQPHHQRMAAQLGTHGLSLEHARLRADRTARAGADRLPDRPVGPDVPQRCDLRFAGGADRRHQARAQAMDRAGRSRVGADRDGRVRRRAPVARTHPHASQGQAAHHAAEPAAGCQVQLLRQGGGDAEISGTVRPLVGPQSTGVRDATVLIWPESAFPFFLTREPDAMAQIADLLPKGTVLITGSVRAPDVPPGTRIRRAYNSIYLIDHDGNVLSVYDKLHLVPFGEFLPFQDWMENIGLEQLTKVQGGFIPGTHRRTMNVPNAPRMLPM